MKKLVLFLIILLCLVGCGSAGGNNSGGNSGGGQQNNQPKGNDLSDVTKDTSLMKLKFEIPENYTEVERFSEVMASDGSAIEKDLSYAFEDGSAIGYAYTYGTVLADLTDTSSWEQVEIDGKPFLYYASGNDYMLFYQDDKVLYGIDYKSEAEDAKDKLLEYAKSVKLTDSKDLYLDDTSIEGVSYDVDKNLNLVSTAVTLSKDNDATGNYSMKSVTLKFGESDDKLDFRFVVRVYKDTTLDEVLSENKDYGDAEINGISYKTLNDEDKIYVYLTQQGSNVYEFRNNGSNNSGWFVSRSEESYENFNNLMNSIKFN